MTFPDKSSARSAMMAVLRATLPEERAAWSRAVCAQVLGSLEWQGARTVMLFAALPREPDLLPLLGHADGRTMVFPAMVEDRIAPRVVRSSDDLALSPGGIREPRAGCAQAAADEIDLVLVPGLGFTRGGVRLGRGRGHYDRFLPLLRPDVPRVGVCFICQLCDSLPSGSHDVPVHRVITG